MSFRRSDGDNYVQGDFSRLEKLVESLGEKFFIDIGILGENNESEEGGITLAGIGAVHEFGTDKAGRGNSTVIPERSFIRMPLETGQEGIEKEIKPKLKEYIESGNIRGIFELIGIAGEARIQEAFETGGFGKWAPLSEATILRKKSNAILIDEGKLRNAVSSKVGENK